MAEKAEAGSACRQLNDIEVELLSVEERYEPLDWNFQQEGLEAARRQMQQMTE